MPELHWLEAEATEHGRNNDLDRVLYGALELIDTKVPMCDKHRIYLFNILGMATRAARANSEPWEWMDRIPNSFLGYLEPEDRAYLSVCKVHPRDYYSHVIVDPSRPDISYLDESLIDDTLQWPGDYELTLEALLGVEE